MIIKNDKDLANHIELPVERLEHCSLEYVDYATTLESDGYTVIMRMCDEDLPSHSIIITYPFTDDEFEEKLSSLQCIADYLAHEAKGKHGTWNGIIDNLDKPVLLEDEIAEILDERAGQEICIMKSPTIANSYHYSDYQTDKGIVFLIYDALRRHYFVTVGGKNIIDM
jgi:hypothetical protein